MRHLSCSRARMVVIEDLNPGHNSSSSAVIRPGVQESGFWQSPILIPSGGLVCCELCNSRASLYCLADDAFLCRKCDRWVHGANFLALRHARCLLCNTCQNLTQRYVVGIAVKVMLPTILSRVDRNRCESNAKSRVDRNR
ncbi:hypothetical protein ACFX13_024665 [Malus domestica]